jgi:hypothetical protein
MMTPAIGTSKEWPAATSVGAAGWIGLAAAPTFAVMALLTGVFASPQNIFCSAALDTSPLSGMALMYVLMAVFHSTPWLKLALSRRWQELS